MTTILMTSLFENSNLFEEPIIQTYAKMAPKASNQELKDVGDIGNEMKITYTDDFKSDIKKINDRLIQTRINKLIQRLIANPHTGKPLRYDFKGLRSLRVSPFRIIYEITGDLIILHKFEHRGKVYKKENRNSKIDI